MREFNSIFLLCIFFVFAGCDARFSRAEKNNFPSIFVMVNALSLRADLNLAEISNRLFAYRAQRASFVVLLPEVWNLEDRLKENLCIQGGYCWQPMRDWPGQYEIRVDGVLKPDGSGWDLWSGELTEEQPFPSYSHFVLNTNTNQLHVVVDMGRARD